MKPFFRELFNENLQSDIELHYITWERQVGNSMEIKKILVWVSALPVMDFVIWSKSLQLSEYHFAYF